MERPALRGVDLPSVGLALFDYQVACRSDGSAFTFSSARDLTEDHLWITDIPDAKLSDYMAGRSRIKSDSYCQTKLKTVQSDLGLVGLSPYDLVKILRSIFAWTIEMSGAYFGNFDAKADRLVSFDYTRSLPTQNHMKIVLQSALQRYCILTPTRTSFSLYRPPAALFRALGSVRVPVGGFRYHKSVDFRTLESASSSIVFVKIPPEFVQLHLLELSAMSFHGRLTEDGSLWLSSPEYNRLCRDLGERLLVHECVTANHFSTLLERAELLEPHTESSAKRLVREQVSYSLFMLFDGVLGAFLGHGSAKPTLAESYIASLARLENLDAVHALEREGFAVSGYGGSRIALVKHPLTLANNERQHFISVIDSLNLLPPVTDFDVSYAERDGDYFSTAFSIACTGDARSMVELNHHILSTE